MKFTTLRICNHTITYNHKKTFSNIKKSCRLLTNYHKVCHILHYRVLHSNSRMPNANLSSETLLSNFNTYLKVDIVPVEYTVIRKHKH